ncbi:hypothetical protein Trydic_g14728 [Trypoxylus dichotomus]
MIGDLDIDLEELESRLYSQVYHSNENYENENTVHNAPEGSIKLKALNRRYFRTGTFSKQISQNDVNYIPIQKDAQNDMLKSKIHAADFFSTKDTTADQFSTVSMTNQPSPSVVHVVNPCNNILVLPQVPTHIISNGEFVHTGHMSENLEKFLCRQTRKQLKALRNKQKRKEKRERIKQLKAEDSKFIEDGSAFMMHYLNGNDSSPPTKKENADVVIISDSDSDDACIEIPVKRETIVLSDNSDIEGDKEDGMNKVEITETGENIKVGIDKVKNEPAQGNCIKQTKLVRVEEDDDVLIIDLPAKDLEVIDIDCDSKSVTSHKVNSVKSFETNSTNSTLRKVTRKGAISVRDRNELLRTPDSTSSDFLDTGVELQQRRFNFSQHGHDFGHTDVFLKPKSNSEMYETESSCSASEHNASANGNVFNVVDFETPQKDLFDEGGLKVFGDYITPTRDTAAKAPDKFEQVETKASGGTVKRSKGEFSDTSSESDYDNCRASSPKKKKKKLPDLTSVNKQTATAPAGQERFPESAENSVAKRKKINNSDEIATVRSKKSENDEIPSLSINVIDISDVSLEDKSAVEPSMRSKESGTSIADELDVSKIFYVLSDDEADNVKEVKTDIQIVNCKRKDKVPRKVREPDRSCSFSNYWTSDMNKFHNSNWGLENFSVEEIQKTMTDNQKLWNILEEDRQFYRLNTSRGPRCHVCREFGHVSFNCPNGRRPVVCTLCGERGHLEPRCPNGLCTLCGSRGGYGTYCSNCAKWSTIRCRLCHMVGHIDIKCPDLWRRYHLTIEPGPIVKPERMIKKIPQDRWCSGCARRGHYEYRCRLYSRSQQSIDPNIHEYSDLYNFPKDQPFVIRTDLSPPPSPSKVLDRTEEIKDSRNDSSNIRQFGSEPEPSTSRSMESNVGKSDSSDVDLVIISNETQDLTSNDTSDVSALPDDYNVITSMPKECQIHVTFDNSIFPPVEMIPPYFRQYMGYGSETAPNSIPDRSSNDNQTIVRNPIPTATFKPPRNGTSTPKKVGCRQKKVSSHLNALQYGFALSKKGLQFINQLHSQLDVEIELNEANSDAADVDGKLTINGSPQDVTEAHQELLRFLKSPPRLHIIPKYARAASSFLSTRIEKAEKIGGKRQSLYRNLLQLQTSLKSGDNKALLRNNIKSVKVQLNMLLFGKLGLGEGKKHMDKLRDFQRQFAEGRDFKIPFSTLFDVMESYSYIFLDTVAHHYKRYCFDERIKSEPSEKEMRIAANYYKITRRKCRNLHMPDKLRELERFRTALYARFTTKAFKEFMTFCNHLLHFAKNQY